jgi:hypothetical protein
MSISTRAELEHHTTLAIPFGQLHNVIEWCQGQLEDDWQFHVIEDAGQYLPGYYAFCFKSGKDLVKFSLWKK